MIDKITLERETKFSPGFRLTPSDIAILIIGAVFSFNLGKEEDFLGLAFGFLVIHFFLFCCVIRMSQALQWVWSGIYLILFTLTVLAMSGAPEIIRYWNYYWNYLFGLSLISTVLITIIQMNRADYHGVFWTKINPKLHDWWMAHSKAR